MKMKIVKVSHKNKVYDSLRLFSSLNMVDENYMRRDDWTIINNNDSSNIGDKGFNYPVVNFDKNNNKNKNDKNNLKNNKNNKNNNDINGIKNYDTYIWTKEILPTKEELKEWKTKIVENIEDGKNIYNMARLYRIGDSEKILKLIKKYGINYYDTSDPLKYKKLKNYSELGLCGIKSPVIAVVGTGRRCGKFTTTMTLKKQLEIKKNKDIGVVGTEPQSLLCNCDEMVIPQVIPMCHVPSTILGAVKKVDLADKDIIFVSGQTGLFANSLEVGTGRGGAVCSLSILYGSKPNYIILSTDSTDINYIMRHIKFLKLINDSWEIIGISIKNSNLPTDDYVEKLNNLENALNIPVVDMVIGHNTNSLIDNIVDRVF